jgi:hypothetical protein
MTYSSLEPLTINQTDKYNMTYKVADNFFNDIDFTSIVSTVKGIMTSDGSISLLLDFERVLDELDLYAFKNWDLGELVQGPNVGRYTVSCVFMWPYKLMPDPHAVKRLLAIGCRVNYHKGELKVPVEVKNYDDFIQGTNYPKSVEKKVWFVHIEIPLELMDDIKEGSIDLADQSIDLEEIDSAYDDDLDKAETKQDDEQPDESQSAPLDNMAPMV